MAYDSKIVIAKETPNRGTMGPGKEVVCCKQLYNSID